MHVTKLILSLALIILLIGCTDPRKADIPLASVKITNLAGTSGGSGTVITSTSSRSTILTNQHVCALAKHSAIVSNSHGEVFRVVSYRIYKKHDLCLITVFGDFHTHIDLSDFQPQAGQPVVVSGHPHLLPTTTTYGNVSGKMPIDVMIGTRPCTDEERGSDSLSFECAFFRGMPIIKNYETLVISALISSGSSGSGVFDADGQLVAVVFAGAGDLSYGFTVPYEYVQDFLLEIKTTVGEEHYPDSEVL